MDDILVLAPTRWKLRKAARVVNRVLATLRLEKHPDKTFIGRIEKGFDWLGYHISPEGLSIATKTLENFATRCYRLYEQGKEEPLGSSRLGDYVRRWAKWVMAGTQTSWRVVLVSWMIKGGPPAYLNSIKCLSEKTRCLYHVTIEGDISMLMEVLP